MKPSLSIIQSYALIALLECLPCRSGLGALVTWDLNLLMPLTSFVIFDKLFHFSGILFSLLISMASSSSDNLWFYNENIYLGGKERDRERKREREKRETEEERRLQCIIIIEYSDIFVVYKEVKCFQIFQYIHSYTIHLYIITIIL